MRYSLKSHRSGLSRLHIRFLQTIISAMGKRVNMRIASLVSATIFMALIPINLALPAQTEVSEKYIVQYLDSANMNSEEDDRKNRNVRTVKLLDRVFKGAVVEMTATQATEFRKNSRVALIEKDGVVTASAITTQSPATWGLDRINQKALPLDNSYSFETNASDVTAFVIDTGILATHNEISGRVLPGWSAITTGGTTDCNGHGTHVAATIGGSTYGVAKGISLVPVRVLDCAGSGFISDVIAGINWAVTNKPAGPSVISMSLGGGASQLLDNAVSAAIEANITVVVAAGNDGRNACNYSPARVPNAITVGATDNRDALATFSNTGSCVDISAPGVNITSAWIGTNSATTTISGTSMATPHVTGAVALALSGTTQSPAQVQATINSYASTFVSRSSTSTRLLNTSVAGSTPAPVLTAPSVPRNVSVSAGRNNGSLAVTWQAPSAPGSGVTSYTARAYTAATGGSPIQSCSATTTSCTISNLTRRATYYVDVTATGPGGASSASTPRVLRATN
jgi:subtilisin family serine protease